MSPARVAAAVAAALALAAAGGAGCAGCDPGAPPPLTDCAGRLHGVWTVAGPDSAAAGSGEPLRLHAIATRTGWELLPVVDDGRVEPGGRVVAPGALALPYATGPTDALDGEYARRFEQAGAICVVTTPARLHTCRGNAAQLDVSPPRPPVDPADCATAPTAPTVTWTLRR